MIEVVLARGDQDWEALYVNGVLELQNHSLSLVDVLTLLSNFWEPIDFRRVDVLEGVENYPDRLEDLPTR